jgi:hypothetical protein
MRIYAINGMHLVAAGFALVLHSYTALAGVSAQEAAKLKSALTPVGAEREGNKAGTIPAWTGGYTTPRRGQDEVPYSKEKPLFAITAANFSRYAENLPEGAKELFRRYPDYRMNVYPTHRSAAMPSAVYENTFLNATRARPAPAGIAYGVEGAAAGIPFPIPKSGTEAVWNHLLAFWGAARETRISTYVASPGGTIELASTYDEVADFPYYYSNASTVLSDGYYFKTRHIETAPASRVGEGYLAWQPIDTAKYKFAAWRLLPGQHRVRRAPSLSYDIPDADASGFQNLDEYYIFFGGPDRYDFRLIGKAEMYVPYNNNRLYQRPVSEVMKPTYANPDDLRYELHRVWIVDGVLAPGKHHIAPHRRLYLDEDTWFAVYSDSWNENGKLWKFGEATMYLIPEVPAVIIGSQFVYDFDLGGYVYGFVFKDGGYKVTAPHPISTYSPDAFAALSTR